MRRLVLALLLATPLAASAQYLYPPPPPVRVAPAPYAPPPPPPYAPPPPPAYVAPRQPALSPYYFNLGIGGGWQSYFDPYGYLTVGGLAYNVEAGVRLAPQLLFGFDLAGLTTFGNDYYGTLGSTALDYDAVLTVFPFTRGLFLKAGGGLSTLTMSVPYAPGVTYVGGNVLFGAGWAFPVANPLHLTLGVDWTQQFYGSPDFSDPSIWMMRVGVGFY